MSTPEEDADPEATSRLAAFAARRLGAKKLEAPALETEDKDLPPARVMDDDEDPCVHAENLVVQHLKALFDGDNPVPLDIWQSVNYSATYPRMAPLAVVDNKGERAAIYMVVLSKVSQSAKLSPENCFGATYLQPDIPGNDDPYWGKPGPMGAQLRSVDGTPNIWVSKTFSKELDPYFKWWERTHPGGNAREPYLVHIKWCWSYPGTAGNWAESLAGTSLHGALEMAHAHESSLYVLSMAAAEVQEWDANTVVGTVKDAGRQLEKMGAFQMYIQSLVSASKLPAGFSQDWVQFVAYERGLVLQVMKTTAIPKNVRYQALAEAMCGDMNATIAFADELYGNLSATVIINTNTVYKRGLRYIARVHIFNRRTTTYRDWVREAMGSVDEVTAKQFVRAVNRAVYEGAKERYADIIMDLERAGGEYSQAKARITTDMVEDFVNKIARQGGSDWRHPTLEMLLKHPNTKTLIANQTRSEQKNLETLRNNARSGKATRGRYVEPSLVNRRAIPSTTAATLTGALSQMGLGDYAGAFKPSFRSRPSEPEDDAVSDLDALQAEIREKQRLLNQMMAKKKR